MHAREASMASILNNPGFLSALVVDTFFDLIRVNNRSRPLALDVQ